MKLGGVEIHGVLLGASLLLAYGAWTSEAPEEKEDEVAIWDLAKAQVTGLSYEAEGRAVELKREAGEGTTDYVWAKTVRERKKPKVAKTDPKKPGQAAEKAGPTSAPAAEGPSSAPASAQGKGDESKAEGAQADEQPEAPEMIKETKEFLGNSRSLEVLDGFLRPVAKRSLGELSPEDLKALSLDADSEAKVTIQTSVGPRSLRVGVAAYGGGLRYVREATSNTAFVVPAKLVDDLKWADSRLIERNLQPFKEKDVEGFSLQVGERKRAFVRPSKGSEEPAGWRDADHPDGEISEAAATWLSKLFRVRVDRYVSEAAAPPAADASEEKQVLRVELQAKAGLNGFLEMSRRGAGKDAVYRVRTAHTRRQVLVSRYLAGEVERDLEGLLEAQAPKAP